MAAAVHPPPTKLEQATAVHVAIARLVADLPGGLEGGVPPLSSIEANADIRKCELWAPRLNETIEKMQWAANLLTEAAKHLAYNRNNIPLRKPILDALNSGESAGSAKDTLDKLIKSYVS